MCLRRTEEKKGGYWEHGAVPKAQKAQAPPSAHSAQHGRPLSTQAARVPLGVEKVLDTSSYLFPTGKDIQEEERVSQALRDVPGAWRRWVT